MSSELSALYKNRPVILWVEDELTRIVLRALWQDPDIGLLIAGGSQAVRSTVNDARRAGHENVFGIRDRDFGRSNQERWLRPESHVDVLIPDAFEIENHLLQFDALAGLGAAHNPRCRTAAELQAKAQAVAEGSLWWMAVRATIAASRVQLTDGFPAHPSLRNAPSLRTEAEALATLEERLLQSEWGLRVQNWVPTLDRAWIVERMREQEARLRADLESGSWRFNWSGKEVLAVVADDMGCGVADVARGLAGSAGGAGDFAALRNLHAAIRKRSGLDDW
ncbi:MAG: hypothetical protein H6747_12305 [Deltaproteobacteria bacterium]|nr:hypothetical protein [Deltaproteobacteria bacterium]